VTREKKCEFKLFPEALGQHFITLRLLSMRLLLFLLFRKFIKLVIGFAPEEGQLKQAEYEAKAYLIAI